MAPRVSSGTPECRPIDSVAATTACAARNGGIDVAISLAHDRGFGRSARFEFAGLLVRMQNCRQFLDVESDELGCILGEIRIVGENGRHRLADIAHPAAGEEPLAIGLQPLDAAETKIDRRNVGNIGGRPHRVHAG